MSTVALCAGDCFDVDVVPTGGRAPFSVVWNDGDTSMRRHFCPTSTTQYLVAVTDADSFSGVASDRSKIIFVSLDAEVSRCEPHDAGAPEGGIPSGDAGCNLAGGMASLESGHYTGALTCAAGQMLGWAPGVSSTFELDLSVGRSQEQQSGTLYVVLSAGIALNGTLHQGVLDCQTGELRADWDGKWGVPIGFPTRTSVSDSGDLSGALTAVRTGTPGEIFRNLELGRTNRKVGPSVRMHGFVHGLAQTLIHEKDPTG